MGRIIIIIRADLDLITSPWDSNNSKQTITSEDFQTKESRRWISRDESAQKRERSRQNLPTPAQWYVSTLSDDDRCAKLGKITSLANILPKARTFTKSLPNVSENRPKTSRQVNEMPGCFAPPEALSKPRQSRPARECTSQQAQPKRTSPSNVASWQLQLPKALLSVHRTSIQELALAKPIGSPGRPRKGRRQSAQGVLHHTSINSQKKWTFRRGETTGTCTCMVRKHYAFLKNLKMHGEKTLLFRFRDQIIPAWP